MKKILLLAAAALMVTTANAQLKRSEMFRAPALPQAQLVKPEAIMVEEQMRTPGTPVIKAPNRAGNIEVWYRRPAGAFCCALVVEDGVYTGSYYSPYLAVKPYCDYTFNGYATGQSDEAVFEWNYQFWGYNADGSAREQQWATTQGQNLTWQWGYETDTVPTLYVVEPDGTYGEYTYGGYKMSGTSAEPIIDAVYPGHIMAIPSTMDLWDRDILKSSKTLTFGGRYGNNRYMFTYMSGAQPYGDNEKGWWFGKNAGTTKGVAIDGIAQAFEKPEHPYLLNNVALYCTILKVAAQVDLTCKIYKLDEIPAYNDSNTVVLPDEPGELIAKGRATLTPETDEATGGMVYFTLYGEEDGLEYDIAPTIDCPILVAIDGYNAPEMANLTDFSAMISTDRHVDEGFGELAYLKYGVNDEDGNLDHYVWRGLNNFFSSGEMKTGLTILLSTELPYLTFNYNAEDGEYSFPVEGGLMEKTFGSYTTRSIEFWSWEPSENDNWFVSCGDEDVPAWLDITLSDEINESGEFSGLVNAEVTAEPLPEGVSYREAIVRFEYPGAYLDYKFMQGEKSDNPYDVNGDGEVNIADVNALIDMILSGGDFYDCNGDGEMNIADVNALIDTILNA